ncbi:adhesion G protein-coupled receptor E5 isoform X2 [Rhineura floridana]|uniref:adhesion G protein-coupled receptor E5 isoform X2 n=1 Tax=Rhineura floridana TaxID=261503 RepID=UPI002AC7F158|nr:adhesion G protein-coupled receptor E5 isoform X2 [Rhineura floridana]
MELTPRLLLALGLFITLNQSRATGQNGETEDCSKLKGEANCPSGYKVCEEDMCCDIDECIDCGDCGKFEKVENLCGAHATCKNSCGNYSCVCVKGFQSKSSNITDCEDIDECDEGRCDKSANCSNYPGGFRCSCLPGYVQYMDVGPGGENTTKCKEFSCPSPSSDVCADEQTFLCNFTAQLRHLCNSSLTIRDAKDAENRMQGLLDLLDLLDDLATLMKAEKQRHRMVTEMMETVETLLRVLAFTLPNKTMSAMSKDTELTIDIRTAGSPSQGPATLSQNKTQMELSWGAVRKEGDAFGMAGLLSYHSLGPFLTGAVVEGKEWEQVGKSPQCAQLEGKPSYKVLSSVASAFVGHHETTSLSAPVRFNFSHKEPDSKPDLKLICAFWKPDNGSGLWSQEGCTRLNSSTADSTHCQCNHLTSFAVLMAFYDVEDWGLDVITKIGLVMSLICLFLSILTFLFCRAIRGIRTTIHLHLCLALFVGDVIFLMGVGNPGNQTTCAVVAGLLHLFFLSVFCWMLLEGVELYLMVVQVFKTHSLKHWHLFFVGYGLPAIVVGISAAINSNGYGNKKNCWLAMDNGFQWSFLAPVTLIIMVNAAVFVVTVWKLSQKFADINPDMSKLKKQRVLTITAIAQLCILGTTWVFGLFQFSNHTLVMSYIFTILNSLQGLFIFLLHCLLKKQVRDDYYRWFCKDVHGKPHSSDKYSEFSSTASSNTLRTPKSWKESGM